MTRGLGRRAALAIVALAFATRAGFALWAPDQVYGDPLFYAFYGHQIANGNGFTENDGSPGIFWPPGWPLVIAGVYTLVGEHPGAVVALEVLLGSLTALGVAGIGARLLGRRTGLAAGVIYALWPGNVYLTAVLLSETAFLAWLVASLWLLLAALEWQGCKRVTGLCAAGVLFGAAALTKAEPLALLPVLAAVLALRVARSDWLVHGGALLLGIAVVLAPWALRNQAIFGAPIVTSASGGTNFWIGNHRGATGMNDLPVETWWRLQHQRDSFAETNLAQNAAGWREGLAFVRAHPREALALVPRKLRATYASDAAATRNLRPLEPPVRGRLERVANLWWYAVLALALVGVGSLRRASPTARLLLLGIPATWLLIHIVFIGGARFHAPETPSLAVLAAAGLERLRRALPPLRRSA